MLLHGQCSNPVLTGSSVHNQRVERLWRDTYRCVLSVYYQVFYYLEDTHYLDQASNIDLFCLHFVYEDKINKSLKSFVDGWNCHGLSTENNLSPFQLFVSSNIQMANIQDHAPSSAASSTSDILAESVEVPSTACPLSHQHQVQLRAVMQSDQPESSDYGIELYKRVREFVYGCLTESACH